MPRHSHSLNLPKGSLSFLLLPPVPTTLQATQVALAAQQLFGLFVCSALLLLYVKLDLEKAGLIALGRIREADFYGVVSVGASHTQKCPLAFPSH